jgi:hypothetical protein
MAKKLPLNNMIRHISVSVKNPKRSAEILAELTNGRTETFNTRGLENGWVCIWNDNLNKLVEFLPEGFLMYPTETGASFKKVNIPFGYNSTHLQVETRLSLSQIKEIAEKFSCKNYFREQFGGPLFEVWIEDELLVELIPKNYNLG